MLEKLLSTYLELDGAACPPARMVNHRQHGAVYIGCVGHTAVPDAQIAQD
jgi:hypothetical protein